MNDKNRPIRLWQHLSNLFFPRLCLLCRTPLTDGEKHLCLSCLYSLPRTGYAHPPGNPVEQLFAGKTELESAVACFRYEKKSRVQQLVHTFKYRDNPELAYYLGRIAALEIVPSGIWDDVDLLVPVPLHRRKEKARGYNQARQIACGLASVLARPVADGQLIRSRPGDTQTRKNVFDRWTNVSDAYTVVAPDTFRGKHLLLVDDVVTTGATLEACARTITARIPARISVFTLAAAER